jgi:two-component system chemotaxis sensor kinase CheA
MRSMRNSIRRSPRHPWAKFCSRLKPLPSAPWIRRFTNRRNSRSRQEEDATIRVETKRLDSVMNLVGELVLGRNRLIKIGTQLEQNHESDPAGARA